MKCAPPLLETPRVSADEKQWWRLISLNRTPYRVESRAAARRRTRLQSAKILDASGAFLCDAAIQDASELGLRLALASNCGVPARFGVHLDLTGEVLTATLAWRRDRVIGARVISHQPPAPLKPAQRAALAGRYYGMKA